ncbi:MAG: GNAT family N-acetyltransferase [Anaerolineae bacterium]|nr:GNAT family N-acetyltransferase [Anaerolineae bacterium]
MTANPAILLLQDPDWMLAHFTLAADLTSLRETCHFARSSSAVVARYEGLPFTALAFLADDPEVLSQLAAQLVAPEESFYLLLNRQQAALAEQAFAVKQVDHEWQMLHQGDPLDLDPGSAVPLGTNNQHQMGELAADAGLMALEDHPFRHGPAFGLWDNGQLVAMASTHLQIPGAVEIGNIATRSTHRCRGLARQAVSALTRLHRKMGDEVFLLVFQSNEAAIGLYEQLGFIRKRAMYLMRCRLG